LTDPQIIDEVSRLPEGEYAIVELLGLGHSTLVGRISEVERFGTKMLAIEVLFNGMLLPVVFQGGASIYRLTPCPPEVAWAKHPDRPHQLPLAIAAIVPSGLLPGPIPAEEYQEFDDDDHELA